MLVDDVLPVYDVSDAVATVVDAVPQGLMGACDTVLTQGVIQRGGTCLHRQCPRRRETFPRYLKLIRFTSARKRGSSWRFFHVGSTLRNTIIGSRASNARSSHAMASDRSFRPLHAIATWYGDT